MDTPTDRKYSKEHEWAQAEPDGTVRIGITFFAQDELGDVVHVELPPVGTQVERDKEIGEVESVKTVSDLYSPVSGVVVEVNQALVASPEVVNEDPYGLGWMVRVRIADSAELESLLDAGAYNQLTGG